MVSFETVRQLAHADETELGGLPADAWSLAAPKRLAVSFGADQHRSERPPAFGGRGALRR